MTREDLITRISARSRANGCLRPRDSIINDLIVLEEAGLLKLDPPDETDKPFGKCRCCNARLNANLIATNWDEPAHAPIVRHTYAEDLYRDALERVACAVDRSYIVMHPEAGEHTETVYGFIRRTLASVSK